MTTIEVTESDATRLGRILEGVLSDLHTEIRHTDDRAFRDSLKEDQEFLQNLVQRLKTPADQS